MATVEAESIFEAVVCGVKAISESWSEEPGLMTKVEVAVTPVRHEVTLKQVRDWLNRSAGSPKEMVLKNRLKAMLPQ